jgi:hypothetical protein
MLQIISGKFFSGKGTVNERETFSVLYSNYSWIAPIHVQVADLVPAGFSRSDFSPFVLRYMNRYEQLPGEILVLATDGDVTTQFRLLASFWLRAFFYPDRNYVELLCRPGPRNAQDKTVPRHFVPRFFDASLMGTAEEVAGFPPFVKQVLGLPRKKYNLFMSCLGVYFDALEAIGTNFDLAYSMYVYLLEALSQSKEGTPAAWDDYEQQVRVRLDEQLAKVEPGVAASIREILVTSSHLRLTKRFVEFVLGHVEDSYFTAQAEQIKKAIPKSYLRRALENLYRTRSGYVHSLKELETALQFPPHVESADIVPGRDEPYFTFAGLVRLCRHVLLTFLGRQECVEKEPDYPWRSEIPGRINARLAPQYWIWQDANFTPPQAKARLSGLIEHLVYSPNAPPPDMRKVLERIESSIHGAKAADRPAMLMLYWLFAARIEPPCWLPLATLLTCP